MRALLLALCAAGCGPAGVPFPDLGEPSGPRLAEQVGVALAVAWGDAPEARARRDAQLDRLASLGVRQLRTDFLWYRLETARDQWDFSQLDPMVDAVKARGITVLALACYGNPIYPAFGQGGAPGADDLYPPQDPSAYARYVRAIAEHFEGRVSDFELWNEQNAGYRFFKPLADAPHYAAMADAAAQEGRAACPACRFIFGGLFMPQLVPGLNLYPSGRDFLAGAWSAEPGLARHLDAVGYHPYQYPHGQPEDAPPPQKSLATRTLGVSLPLWNTENGWPTNPGVPPTDTDVARVYGIDPMALALGRGALGDAAIDRVVESLRGVSEADQARFLVRSVLLAQPLGVSKTFLYTLDDNLTEHDINQESAFGIFLPDGTPKAAAAALRTLLLTEGELAYAGDVGAALGLSEPDHALAFRGEGTRAALAIWRANGEPSSLRLGVPRAAVLRTMAGEVTQSTRGAGTLSVPLDGDVAWVELD